MDRGECFRSFNLLRVLASQHEVTLLSFIEKSADPSRRAAIEALGVRVHTVNHSRRRSLLRMALSARLPTMPFQIAQFESSGMRALVREYAAQTDVVIACLVRMAPYLEEVPRGVRKIVDLCDAVSSEVRASIPHRRGIERIFSREEAKRVAAYERALVARVDEVWLVTRAEVGKICGTRSVPANVIVVANGMDVPAEEPPPRRATDSPRLLFTGNLRVSHNVDAARVLVRRVLPRVLERLPGAHLHLAGADPSSKILELAGPNVTVHGYVDDLHTFLRTGDVFVAPMRYVAGIQTKILEAMAVGIPVVTTPIVNRGLGANAGIHLLLASDPEELASLTVRVAEDASLAGHLSRESRLFVKERYRWDAALERFSGGVAAKPDS